MKRMQLLVGIVPVTVLVMTAAPAGAITFGELDDYVGLP